MALIQTPNLMYYYYNEFARSLTKSSIFLRLDLVQLELIQPF